MERRHRADGARAGIVIAPAAAELQDSLGGVEELARRGAAEKDQEVRVAELDLAFDEGPADRRFLRRRPAVAGRAPGDDVGDIDLVPRQADRREHAVEKLAGPADEGQALDVLVAARRFADQHDPAFRIAVGEDELRRRQAEIAAVERQRAPL